MSISDQNKNFLSLIIFRPEYSCNVPFEVHRSPNFWLIVDVCVGDDQTEQILCDSLADWPVCINVVQLRTCRLYSRCLWTDIRASSKQDILCWRGKLLFMCWVFEKVDIFCYFYFCNNFSFITVATLSNKANTHSLTAALDQLRVMAISIMSSPGLQIDRHWWVDPYLLPPVEAKFSVDDPVGVFSQRPKVCQWRRQWIDVGLVTQVYSWITDN